MIDRPTLAILDLVTARITGRHRARFLHAMTTTDVAKMTPGQAGFAMMATSNGRHIGQVRLEVEADAIVMSGRRTSVEAVLEGLKKHKVADDVKWVVEGAGEGAPLKTTTLAVHGSFASQILGAVFSGLEGVDGGRWVDVQHPEHGSCRLIGLTPTESELGVPTVLVRTAADGAARLRVRLLAAGAEPMDEATWDKKRVEAGWPLDGIDVGSDDVALASDRLGANVSWSKGCFLGQEVYVMARDRGELPKKLRAVRLSAGERPGVGDLVEPESGKVVGRLGSVVPSGGGWLGLAMMKRKSAEPGTPLMTADGREGRVVTVPLGASL